jgi:hypothetical protein
MESTRVVTMLDDDFILFGGFCLYASPGSSSFRATP